MGSHRHTPTLLLTAALAIVLVAPATTASAALRSTHLESSCSSGYAYAEFSFASWTVEGCSKQAIVLTGQEDRRYFRGDLEVNGMKFEISDSGPDLTATELDDGSGTLFRSTSTSIVLDPLVNGTRKRFVLYTGTIDLEAHPVGGGGADVDLSADPPFGSQPAGGSAASKRPRAHDAALVGIGTSYVDLPMSGTPKILGLRLRDSIHDAAVRPQNGSIAATVVFDAELSLGTGISALLDVTANSEITLTDGVGMKVTNLEVDFPTFPVPGIGGLKNTTIEYSSSSDTWTGTLLLDLGNLFPQLDFELEVSASTGVPVYIRTEASNLPPIPIGTTGIVLDSVRMSFGLDPLAISAGASATAGPTIAGTALILLDGDISMEFEPSFRLEVDGGARVLPTGSSSELASGTFGFVYDADGLIAVSGSARFEAAVAGIGIGAQIRGSGAYATTRNRFNVEASADGELLLGFLGDFNVAHFAAVVSSDGWGACGRLFGFLSGGVGQDWDNGMQVFTGCDLTPYDAPIAGASVHVAQNGIRSRTFPVAAGTKQIGIELTADAPGPRVRLRSPDGKVLTTAAGDRKQLGENAVVLGKADANMQLIALRNPPAGTYTVEWRAEDPQITGLRTARDAPDLVASAKVSRKRGDRAGLRHVTVHRASPLGRGEKLLVGVRTRNGLVELGAPTDASSFTATYDENQTGKHDIVAMVVRDGIPIATRKAVIGRYTATLPARPASISKRRRGHTMIVKAKLRKGAEPPDAWQYLFRAKNGRRAVLTAKVGKRLVVNVPRFIRKVTVSARPVVRGRALR
jgi:hypothetical protein